jgi:hypothetical protein
LKFGSDNAPSASIARPAANEVRSCFAPRGCTARVPPMATYRCRRACFLVRLICRENELPVGDLRMLGNRRDQTARGGSLGSSTIAPTADKPARARCSDPQRLRLKTRDVFFQRKKRRCRHPVRRRDWSHKMLVCCSAARWCVTTWAS